MIAGESRATMGIVFFCQSCGARFEVDPRQAGKRGRCRKCHQLTTIPRAEELTSTGVRPVLAAAGAAGRVALSPLAAEPLPSSFSAWLKSGISQVGLAPLPEERPRPRPTLPSALDDAEDSRPYPLAAPNVDDRGPVRIQDHPLLRLWRRAVGRVQKVFRWLNEGAYVASIPFVMILLVGAAVKSRPMALFGATFVILLNLGRLAAGAVNLALVPLRDGLDRHRLHGPVRRVLEPIATIALVILGFTFIPWLSGTRPARGGLPARLRAATSGLKKDIEGEVGLVVDKARKLDAKAIGDRARRELAGSDEAAGVDPPRDSP